MVHQNFEIHALHILELHSSCESSSDHQDQSADYEESYAEETHNVTHLLGAKGTIKISGTGVANLAVRTDLPMKTDRALADRIV